MDIGRKMLPPLAALGLLATLSGCAAEPPVTMWNAAVCMPAKPGDQVAYGDALILSDSAKGPVIIDSIEIPGAPGTESYVIRIGAGDGIGTMSLSDAPEQWESRVSAEGYRVEPGAEAHIVALFPPELESLEESSMVVTYHTENGREYKVTSGHRITVDAEACF